MLIFSSQLLDTFVLCSFFLIFELPMVYAPYFSSHCRSSPPLSLLFLPFLCLFSTYQCETQIWTLKFDCFELLLGDYSFWSAILRFNSAIYKGHIFWNLPLSLFFGLQYPHQMSAVFLCITPIGIETHDRPPNLCPILSITLPKR